MGNADKFNSLVLAFSQMRSTGKLMGQDLLQMINAGFNPLAVISEQTGKSIGALKDDMAAGAISADMITKAFMDATSEGGKFYGMLETQSRGVEGQLSNLEGAFEDMLNSIGEKSQGIITGSIQAATDLVNNYERVGEVIAELVATYGVYKAALIIINTLKAVSTSLTAGWTAAELAHYNALVLVEKAQKILNATILKNPYVLAAAAVAGLAYGLYKLITYQTDAEKAQERLNDATEEFEKTSNSEITVLNIMFSRLNKAKEGTNEYQAAKEAIQKKYGDYLNNMSSEVSLLKDTAKAQKELTEAILETSRARAQEKFLQQESDIASDKQVNALRKIREGLINEKGEDVGEALFEQIKSMLVAYQSDPQDRDGKKYMGFVKLLRDNGIDNGIGYGKVFTTAYTDYVMSVQAMLKAQKEAEAYFGAPSTTAGSDGGDETGGKKEVVKNKKYWEEYKKEQQGLLDAMTAAELQTEEAAKIRRNIADAQAQIDAYSVTSKSSEHEQKQENQLAVQAASRSQKIQEYADTVAREARQAEFDIRQAHIDGMAEGVDKELAQNNLNYDRLIEANRRRQEEMVEKLRDMKEFEWKNANPKAKEQGLSFDRSTITAADLSPEQLDILKEYERIAGEIRIKANKESIDKVLSDVLTYEQKRTDIAEEYERKRKSLYTTDAQGNKVLRQGVTQGNVDELDRQEEQALNDVDEQFAQREATYQAWCEEVANLTLEQLRNVLAQAEEELVKLEKSGTADGKQIAVARAKVATAKNKVENANSQNDVYHKKRSVKEWEDLYKVLNECNKSFEEIGDTVGGVAGEIISAAGGIMTSTLSMINGIVQLVNMSATGMQGTATAAATAIATVEKASVILAVISAAMQIAMQIINLFNTDDKKQEEIEALQERIDQLQWELDNADAVRLQQNSFKAMDLLRQVTEQLRQEMVRLKLSVGDTWGAFRAMFTSVDKDNTMLQESAKKVAEAYANISYTADKALGMEKYDDAKNQLQNIAKQQLLIQEQINKEDSKKKTDQGKIEEWERQIQELGEQAVTIINDMVEDIIGGSSSEIANELADAFFEAFKAGEDAAEAWGDKVNDIVADVLKRMLVSKFLEEPLGQIFDRYKAKWFKDGQFAGLDAVINSMSGFASDLNSVGEDFSAIWDSLPDSVKNMFTVTSDATREASEKGIANASQESVDELNGRMTAVQGHTYSINENTKMLVAHSSAILESVMNIEAHTESISRRMERVEDNLSDVRTTVNDMVMKGIKIK